MSVASVSEPSRSQFASSATSGSATTGTESSFDDEMKTIRSRETTIFPLFSEMAQSRLVPRSFHMISEVFCMLQFFVSGFWIVSARVWGTAAQDSEIMHELQYVIDFGLHDRTWEASLPYYIAFAVLALLVIIWHLFVFKSFSYTHDFSQRQLVVTRIEQLIIAPVCLPIYGTLTGVSFRRLGEEILSETLGAFSIVMFILSAAGLIFMAGLFFVAYGLACANPVLFWESFVCSWDWRPYFYMIMMTTALTFVAPALDLFADWLGVLIVIGFIVVCVYCILIVRWFPFQKYAMNSVFLGLIIGNLVAQIFAVVRMLGAKVSDIAVFVVSIVAFIAACIISSILLKRSRKKLASRLMFDSITEEGKISDAEKRSYFDSFVFHSASEVAAYMRIGIADNCDLCLDFSFHHYIIDSYATPEICILTAHMLSFFPSQLQFFGYCLGLIQKMGTLGFIDHFLLFQMRKVHVMRQSSLSKEAASQIRKIRKQSRDAVSTIRSFWVDIVNQPQRLDFGSLLAIYNLSHKIKGIFCDLTDRFTNSQELCEEYSFFLVEGMGDFAEGAKWAAKGHMLEIGKRLDKDFSFWSLMNIYPHYLIDGICDTHGAFIDRSKSVVDSFSSTHNSSSFASSEGGAEQKMEAMNKNLIRQPQLRVAVQLCLKRLQVSGTKRVQRAGYGIFAIALLVYIVIMLIGPGVTATINELIDEIKLSSDAYANIAYTTYACGLTYGNHSLIGTFGGADWLNEWGNIEPDSVAYGVVDNLPGMTYMVSRWAKDHLSNFAKLMIANQKDRPSSAETLFSDLDPIIYVNQAATSQYPELDPTHQQVRTVRVGMPELLDSCANGVTTIMEGVTDDRVTVNDLFQGVWNLGALIGHAQEFTAGVTTDSANLLDEYKQAFFTAEIALAVVFGVFLISLCVVGVGGLFADMMHVLGMMRAVKKDSVTQSLKPILKKSKEETLVTGSSQLVKEGNWPVVFVPALLVVISIADCLGFSIAFLSCSNELARAEEMLVWYENAATRMGAILHIVGCISILPGRSESEQKQIRSWIQASLDRLGVANEILLIGNGDVPGMSGFDATIDQLQFEDQCNEEPTHFYKLGRCFAADRMVAEALVLINALMPQLENTSFTLENADFMNLLILAESGMNDEIYWFKESLMSILESKLLSVMDDLYITSGVMIGVNIASAIMLALVLLQFYHAVEGVKLLLRLLPPEAILRNADLLDLITASRGADQDQVLTPSQTIIKETNQGVMLVMTDYTVSSVNKFFTEITGFTPDEVIGQGLPVVFPMPTSLSSSTGDQTSLAALYESLESMKQNPNRKAAAFQVRYNSSSGREINARLTVVPICYEEDVLDSFAILLQDMSQETSKEQEYYNRKKRCERVMQKIMPDEVFKVIQGEDPERLFVSNSATIIWIEIDGLSECVSSVSPSRMMEALGVIYDGWDEICSQYVAIHQIKYNDTRIIACAGLFDFKDQPSEQVEQSIFACGELISRKDELNEKLALDISFRFGIVMGNMLVGRVLSGETPSFDLDGDIVDLAGKICARCLPGDINVNAAIGQVVDKDLFKVTKAKTSKGDTLEYYRVAPDYQCEMPV